MEGSDTVNEGLICDSEIRHISPSGSGGDIRNTEWSVGAHRRVHIWRTLVKVVIEMRAEKPPAAVDGSASSEAVVTRPFDSAETFRGEWRVYRPPPHPNKREAEERRSRR